MSHFAMQERRIKRYPQLYFIAIAFCGNKATKRQRVIQLVWVQPCELPIKLNEYVDPALWARRCRLCTL